MAKPGVYHSQLFDNGHGGLDTFVPKEVMEALGAKEGDVIEFAVHRGDDRLIVRKAPPDAEVKPAN